jgi:hypothetical protein
MGHSPPGAVTLQGLGLETLVAEALQRLALWNPCGEGGRMRDRLL